MSEVVSSTSNPRVKGVRSLHRRKGRVARNRTLIEGPETFAAFLDEGFVPADVLCTPGDSVTIEACRDRHIPYTLVTDDVLAAASDTRNPRGPVAVIDVPPPGTVRTRNLVVLVDVADPGNVGTIIRTAAALGWDVAPVGATADVWSPKTLRSAAGAHARVRLVAADDLLEAARDRGLTITATVVEGGEPPRAAPGPVALLVGSEAHGLDPGLLERADRRVTLPMPGGTESLNVAVATGIVMYAVGGYLLAPEV